MPQSQNIRTVSTPLCFLQVEQMKGGRVNAGLWRVGSNPTAMTKKLKEAPSTAHTSYTRGRSVIATDTLYYIVCSCLVVVVLQLFLNYISVSDTERCAPKQTNSCQVNSNRSILIKNINTLRCGHRMPENKTILTWGGNDSFTTRTSRHLLQIIIFME